MRNLLSLIFCLVSGYVWAQGMLFGTITDENAITLPYATIYVDELSTGTATNADGKYELTLPNGTHTLVFQYLGYAPLNKTVTIQNGDVKMDIILTPEVIDLETIEVGPDGEDPAYSVMRRAIAKAKFHTQQVDEFTATSYIKGSGRIKDIPRLFRKRILKELEESGMDTATAFVQESVNEIHYKRPDQYDEKVISVRKIGEDNDTSPNSFVNSSFYSSDVAGAISPLSPKAFAYYKFEYLGFFSDRAHTINKIKVIPRSRGDQVFEGTIYIIEDLWSIHSLDLYTYFWGIKFNINQVYEPIEENVWMPVNQIFDVTGSVFGFDFVYKYFANVNDYKITLNPDLIFVPEVIDDKKHKEQAAEADKIFKDQETSSALETLSSGEEISRKQLRKLVREYEKQELEEARQDTLERVTSITTYEVDSMAYERDPSYWDNVRPIPLSNYEVKGYETMDSMYLEDKAKQEEEAQDSLVVTIGGKNTIERKDGKNKFSIGDIFFGSRYAINDKWVFGWSSPLLNTNFNTVEGYHVAINPHIYNKSKGLKWRLDPFVQYSFGRNFWNYKLINRFNWGPRNSASSLSLDVGRYTAQLDETFGIDPLLNTFLTLIYERNLMKVHQKNYGRLEYTKALNDRFEINLSGEYAERSMLYNTSFNLIFDSKKRTYTSNQPWNAELGPTDFEPYNVALFQAGLTARPWLKYNIRNGKKYPIENSSPTLYFQYKAGLQGINDSQPSFHHLDIGYKHIFDWGVRGEVSLQVNAGTFINSSGLGIAEFKHFPTNPTFITTLDPVKSFRMLQPYRLSTQGNYLETHAHYQFRKFLITQFPLVRLTGIRENVFINSLETKSSNHYFELGYGLNYIFRVFRLEVVTAFEDFKFQDWGLRIGVASNLETLFN